MLWLLTVLAGGVGAGARFLADLGLTRLLGSRFPWGTLVVNVSGSFALGVLAGAAVSVPLFSVIGVGLLGGYTTFSSVSVASAALLQERRSLAGILNAIGTCVATVAAAAAGIWLTQ